MNNQNEKSDWTNSKYTYIAAGIIVLALIVWGIYAYNHQNTTTQNTTGQALNNPVATSAPTSTPVSNAGTNKLSYGDAIKAYPERFQFSQCQGTPATIAVRKGTPVMLDNRDSIAHTIKADTESFRIAGYGYDVFYPEVLGNLYVTCDGKDRVTLNVEK
jgi:hypothetical protein